MSEDRKDQPVHIRNAKALLQGIERLQGQVSAFDARMAGMDNRMLALERKMLTMKALLGSGMFQASSGSTVVPDAD